MKEAVEKANVSGSKVDVEFDTQCTREVVESDVTSWFEVDASTVRYLLW